MSRTLKIEGLSDAQCDALAEEAKAAGRKFYDHCRDKLLANMTVAVPQQRGPVVNETGFRRVSQGTPPQPMFVSGEVSPALVRDERVPEPDRIGRLEALMAQMGETLNLFASNPAHLVQHEPVADNPEIDVDDVIGESLRAAEQQGLTMVEREAPAQAGGVRHIGQRRPAPFSVNSVPQHLRNL